MMMKWACGNGIQLYTNKWYTECTIRIYKHNRYLNTRVFNGGPGGGGSTHHSYNYLPTLPSPFSHTPTKQRISSVGSQRALLKFKDVPLRTRRALSLYKVCGDSALLALTWQFSWWQRMTLLLDNHGSIKWLLLTPLFKHAKTLSIPRHHLSIGLSSSPEGIMITAAIKICPRPSPQNGT